VYGTVSVTRSRAAIDDLGVFKYFGEQADYPFLFQNSKYNQPATGNVLDLS
jgi:hypothetical protein